MARTEEWNWYKRNPAKFIRGCRGLGPDVIGAYAIILDLIYEDEDSCPNDPHWLGGILGCSGRKAAGLIQVLLTRGKLQLRDDGRLINERATQELDARETARRRARDSGATGGRRSADARAASTKNKGLGQATLDQPEKSRVEKKEKVTPSAFCFPDWWPKESWEGFVEMRKKIRAPLTDRAVKLLVADVTKFRDRGQNPAAVIDQSTKKNWRGLFEVKINGNGNGHFNGHAAAPATTDGWIARLKAFHGLLADSKPGLWDEKWGPRPDELGNQVPSEALRRFEAERAKSQTRERVH